MGVYIKGFKPKDGLYQIQDGVIRKYKGNGGTVRPYELVEVKEPHGRLIDADALYETLCHIWDRSDSEEFEQAVFESIANAPTVEVPTWIPVSERLPEKDGYYLVSEDDGGIEVEWYDNTGWGYCGVIAWMPLPPIYHGITSK